MSDYETIVYEVNADGLARLTLNRPQERNALSARMVREVQDALTQAHRDPTIRVLLLGANGKAFCPGIGFEKGQGRGPKRPSAVRVASSIPHLLHGAPMLTIAAVNGACAGVGLALACACDLRVASRAAVFRSAFLSVGLAGDMGLPWLLTRIVGAARAREISFLDAKLTADQALHMGLVTQVFDEEAFSSEVDRLTTRLIEGPPLAMRALKAHYLAAARLSFEDFLDVEFQRHFHLGATRDFEEGWKALAERRPPRFTGS